MERIAALLDAAPLTAGWSPQAYTYADLAAHVYGAEEPTAAMRSAVRRAVAALVAQGRAVRYRGDRSGGAHVRVRNGRPSVYANPPGVVVRRPLTAAEQAQRSRLRAAGSRAVLLAGGLWPPSVFPAPAACPADHIPTPQEATNDEYHHE